jgi:hypothetical protein
LSILGLPLRRAKAAVGLDYRREGKQATHKPVMAGVRERQAGFRTERARVLPGTASHATVNGKTARPQGKKPEYEWTSSIT